MLDTHLGHTHLVGGEGASLVRADDGGAAQGLHRGQASDDGILLGHTASSQSKAGGDDSRQACDGWRETLSREALYEIHNHCFKTGRMGWKAENTLRGTSLAKEPCDR